MKVFIYALWFSTSLHIQISSAGFLKGRVALVTGGSRGIGAGIVRGLADNGCTVYVTARSDNQNNLTEQKLGGTLQQLIKTIDETGAGKVFGCYCDHRNDNEIQSVITKIHSEQGRLDILVNNAFQIARNDSDPDLLFRNFWDQKGDFYDTLMNVGLRSHYITTCYAIPLLNITSANERNLHLSIRREPLIVHISSFGGVSYSFNVAYGVGKAGVDRMARDMSYELKSSGTGISCVALYPGVVRTERMTSILDSGEWKRRTGLATPAEFVETPTFTGRVVAGIYMDRSHGIIPQRSGEVIVVAEAAKTLGITDTDGRQPPSIRSLRFLLASIVLGKVTSLPHWMERMLIERSPDILVPMSVMAGGPPEQ